jgi:ribosomal protein S18 acetylase RimI-like enzyme
MMATITQKLTAPGKPDHLRPFDSHRDLRQVADLVELCFADTIDADGKRYLQQMRFAADNPRYLRWAAAAVDVSSLPSAGYVWEEDGKLVGNLSLIPFSVHNDRYYLIANVAVHPEYRKRGIARMLTAQGIEHARKRGAKATWLHVREENEAANNLYRSLGFEERGRRTTWFSQSDVPGVAVNPHIKFTSRRSQDWNAQKAWLVNSYPPELTWHMPLKLIDLRPGITGALYRFFTQLNIRQWTAVQNGQLLGILSKVASTGQADHLWLAAWPDQEDTAAAALLSYARQQLGQRRTLSLDYPSGRASQAIEQAGFSAHQTLVWMEDRLK